MSDQIAPNDALVAQAAYVRMLAETQKFSAEQHKLAEEASKLGAEANKLGAEANKLGAEANKLRGDRWLAPVIAVASVIGAVAASVAAYGTMLRLAAGHGGL